jgi:hypothetical protein
MPSNGFRAGEPEASTFGGMDANRSAVRMLVHSRGPRLRGAVQPAGLPISAQLVEELIDGVQFAGAGDLVVDVFAYREVEHSPGRTGRRSPFGPPGQ